MELSALEVASLVDGELVGDGSTRVSAVGTLARATPSTLTFFSDARYASELHATASPLVLVPRDLSPLPEARTYIRVTNPKVAFTTVAARFHPPKPRPAAGIAPEAQVHPTASVDPSATVMGGVTIGAKTFVGARTILYPGVYLGDDVRIGADSTLKPNVVVLDGCLVGERCLLHPGVIIGADGFGFTFDATKGEHCKIQHIGIARIEDDVELGAHSCVDRATIGETVIGRGTKIDNLVQVGHNCIVGPSSLLCAQVGLAGSTTTGPNVMLGGQAGSAGHLHIGEAAKVGGQAGLLSDVPARSEVLGAPAFSLSEFLRSWTLVRRLPELFQRLRALERARNDNHPDKESPG